MCAYPEVDVRIQRRLWFTLHVLLYCGVALAKVLSWPAHPLLLAMQSALLVTLSLHLYSIYTAGIQTPSTQPVPARIQPDASEPVDKVNVSDDFWYRWHDV
jgi:hypothetical protein